MERLIRHPVEYDITRGYIDRYINPGDKVLDIGYFSRQKDILPFMEQFPLKNYIFWDRKAYLLHVSIISSLSLKKCMTDGFTLRKSFANEKSFLAGQNT